MRRVIVHMHTTLDGRIANNDGGFWEPFAWGEQEMLWLNAQFRLADTWAFGRRVYEAVAPWWTSVASGVLPDDLDELSPATAEFAEIFAGLEKLVFSDTLPQSHERTVINGDIARDLAARKHLGGRDIIVSCGPDALAQLARVPGLIDEYLIVVHPAVINNGPRLFDGLDNELALSLTDHTCFAGGAVVLRYANAPPV